MFERKEPQGESAGPEEGDKAAVEGGRRQWGEQEGPPVAALLQEKRLQMATYAVQPEMEGHETQVVFSGPGVAVPPKGEEDLTPTATPTRTVDQPPRLDEDNTETPVAAIPSARPSTDLGDHVVTPLQDAVPPVGIVVDKGSGCATGSVTPKRHAWEAQKPHVLVTPRSCPSDTVIVRKSSLPSAIEDEGGGKMIVNVEPKEEVECKVSEIEGSKENVVVPRDGGGECLPQVESSGSWVLVGGREEDKEWKERDLVAAGKSDSEAEEGVRKEPLERDAIEAWTGAPSEQVAVPAEKAEELRGKPKDDEMSVEDIESQESVSQVPDAKVPDSIPSSSLDPIPIPAEYLPVAVETPSKPNTSLEDEEEFFTPTGHDLLPKVSQHG